MVTILVVIIAIIFVALLFIFSFLKPITQPKNYEYLLVYLSTLIIEEISIVMLKDPSGPKAKNIQRVIIGVAIIAIFSTIFFYFYPEQISWAFIVFFVMGMTLVSVLTAPFLFYWKFEHWNIDKSSKLLGNIIPINATLIAGILIFLTIQNIGSEDIILKGLGDPSHNLSIPVKSIINALAALTIIPFGISSIVLLLAEDISIFYNKISVPKLGTAFTMSGFAWIVVSMAILLVMSLVNIHTIGH
jgi:hypothetical protein